MRTIIRQSVPLLLICASLAFFPSLARAGLIVSSETVTATPGSAGYVQILLTNDSLSPQALSGFSVDLTLGGLGVAFTGVDDQTNPAYVFSGTGTGALTFDLFPNSGFLASDITLTAAGFVTLDAGATYGLARIAYAVDGAATAGLRPITFAVGPTTQFTDSVGNPYADADITLSSGGIDVQGAATAVPAPPGVVLAAAGGLSLLGYRRRRTRRPA